MAYQICQHNRCTNHHESESQLCWHRQIYMVEIISCSSCFGQSLLTEEDPIDNQLRGRLKNNKVSRLITTRMNIIWCCEGLRQWWAVRTPDPAKFLFEFLHENLLRFGWLDKKPLHQTINICFIEKSLGIIPVLTKKDGSLSGWSATGCFDTYRGFPWQKCWCWPPNWRQKFSINDADVSTKGFLICGSMIGFGKELATCMRVQGLSEWTRSDPPASVERERGGGGSRHFRK